MIKIFIKIFDVFDSYFPDGNLKNRIKCIFYNNDFRKKIFKISFKHDFFIVTYQGHIYKFYIDPFFDFYRCVKGYLREYNLNKGDVVIDCGSYQGVFAILASHKVSETGKVFAFEPDIQNYNLLLDNLELNNIKNVIPINKGLWSENAVLMFNDQLNDRSSFICDNPEKERQIKTPVVSLDEELNRLGISKVDFIKADIEGAELELIKGSNKILLENELNMAIASYHVLNGEKTYISLEKSLENLGYETKTTFKEHLTTYAKKI